MDEGEDYFLQEDEDEETPSGDMWGTYAYAPFIYDIENCSILDVPMYSSVHYNAAMYYQKEIAIGMGAWMKKPMWDAQEPYFDALHEFWTGGMLDYLAEIRQEKEESTEQSTEQAERGIPVTRNNVCTRRKANERNEI